MLAVMIVAAVTYGARKGTVTFPRTSPEIAYLQNDGSYVASNILHIAFTRIIVPDSAALYIDFRAVTNETDDTAWQNFISTTFVEFAAVGQSDFEVENATNYDWVVYTDWTPGPAVQTNGVWHANWGRDRTTGDYIIPVRTAIRLDGDTIATPKSREDSKDDDD